MEETFFFFVEFGVFCLNLLYVFVVNQCLPLGRGIIKKANDLQWEQLSDSFKTHQKSTRKNSFVQQCDTDC